MSREKNQQTSSSSVTPMARSGSNIVSVASVLECPNCQTHIPTTNAATAMMERGEPTLVCHLCQFKLVIKLVPAE